jgi:c-di-GMP-binding flagellar brake protein YcgR
MAAPSGFELPLGELVGNCILDLPGIGPIAVHVRVVNAYAAKERGGRRFGCQFFDLAPLARQMIQRYINRVESEQRKAVQARP